MPGGLLTDLYELTMVTSYLRRGMTAPATFSLFVRELPARRGFLVAAGVDACLDLLEGFSFEQADLDYLGSIGFSDHDLLSLAPLRFDGDVVAVEEGRIVTAGEPILEVTAPLPVAQLVETMLLNQITLHATIASKAARYRIAADGRSLVDFSMRRTHGFEAADAVARASAMVGFEATSNVSAARTFDLAVVGTMAHSYVQAFPSEEQAFRTFAQDHPDRATFLVDTFETLVGVRAAIRVIDELGLGQRAAIRIDSGDLDALSRQVRQALDAAGLPAVRIVVSGGLTEEHVQALVQAGAPIDAFGIGTHLGVAADAPSIDSVYKLVELEGRPILKLSEGKETTPGRKQVWRAGTAEDLLGLRDEAARAGAEPLLLPAMTGGHRVRGAATLAEARSRFEADLEDLPSGCKDLGDPQPLRVGTSPALDELTTRARAEIHARAGDG
jgi:nicotinate phosphoribosyltransferase